MIQPPKWEAVFLCEDGLHSDEAEYGVGEREPGSDGS